MMSRESMKIWHSGDPRTVLIILWSQVRSSCQVLKCMLICVDGEEILGIGDQGVGGILISVAKLVLTTLCAGIHPNRTLAVVLDCGTDNEELINDDLYLGIKKPRVRGKKYDEFVDTFVQAARKHYPKAYIHFEDFGLPNGKLIIAAEPLRTNEFQHAELLTSIGRK